MEEDKRNDELPKLVPDSDVALTLGRREELSIFASCMDVALEEVGAKRSSSGRIEFGVRTSMEPEEAEALRDELRRLDREVRATPPKDSNSEEPH